MIRYTIYAHRNVITNKSYIGMTSQYPPEKRWRENGNGYVKSPLFWNAIQKYGWDNFEHIILVDNIETYKEACKIEQIYIGLFKTDNRRFGYNLDSGGKAGKRLSDESKLKISTNHANFSGENHPLYGTKLKQSTREKIRQSRIGKCNWTKEYINGMKENFKSGGNPRARKVLCITTNQVFECTKDAARWSNQYDGSYIGKCCKGMCEYAGRHPKTGERLKWQYV